MRTLLLWAVLIGASATPATSAAPNAALTGDVWIIHATDPHLFVDTITDQTKPPDKRRVERQRALNERALRDVLARAATLVGVEGQPRLLVLTGDFDTDPCWIAGVPEQQKDENRAAVVAKCLSDVRKDDRELQVKQLAAVLATSPIADIYIVAGNNDIARETAGDAALKYFVDFVNDVQRHIAADGKSAVRVHQLVGCYAGGANAECVADVPDTRYRLVSMPSSSFKNADDPSLVGNDPLQQRQMQTFAALLADAHDAGRQAIVVTHVPDLDDPYALAQLRYADSTRARPDAKVDGRESSVWNVTKPVLDGWTAAVSSDAVAAVLAGHLHDSHKEIYRQPYAWSTGDGFGRDRGKLFVTPPLAVKNQDTSPIQARGFSLIHLRPNRIQRQLYWYDAVARTFAADAERAGGPSQGHGGFWQTLRARGWRRVLWLWRLTTDAPIERLSVLLIAFLVAFLTVARVWQIPPSENPLVVSAAANPPAPAAFEASPFAGNFGKTVMAGLGGLVAETVMKSLVPDPPKNDKEFYVIWFVIFFFTMLMSSAFVRALAEALRTRLARAHYVPQRPAFVMPQRKGWRHVVDLWKWFWNWIVSWVIRFREWCFSWRGPLLVFFDTFFNFIQGKNQAVSKAFADVIVEQQRNTVRVADAIGRRLNELIVEKLYEKRRAKAEANVAGQSAPEAHPSDVRVNISVLSADQSSVFYISKAPGSAVNKSFPKRSVAWVCVFAGVIRWYKKSYKEKAGDIVLFDNSTGVIAGDEQTIHLNSHYQLREDDYEAFVVFPAPWPHRAYGSDYVKGAIHISFRRAEDFAGIWKIPSDSDSGTDPYADEKKMLEDEKSEGGWCTDPGICGAIRNAIAVVGELLRGFNENISKNST